MFTKTEKYNAVLAEVEKLKASLETLTQELSDKDKALEDQTSVSHTLQTTLDNLNARDLQTEIDSLISQADSTQKEIEKKNAETEAVSENNKIKFASLSKVNTDQAQEIKDLNATIDRLNKKPPVPTAEALSDSDDSTSKSDIIAFCEENSDNKEAIFARFAEEGL